MNHPALDVSDREIFPVQKVSKDGRETVRRVTAREFPATILLNGQELVTLLCSPCNLDCLAVGFLASEGLVNRRDEIRTVLVDDQRGIIRVETTEAKEIPPETLFKRLITSGCGRGASFYSAADASSRKVDSQLKLSADELYGLVKEFQHRSELYRTSHGVHSAALCDTKAIKVFDEDIGRHNAIDKVFGKCFLDKIPTMDRIMITSGRISSEIVHKVAKRDVPIIIALSSPTDLGVRIAEALNITLIGSAKATRFDIYANEWRIISGS